MRLKKDHARVAARAFVDALAATIGMEGGDAQWRTPIIV
jgi:cob(I)alamin adenosyltransferase